MTVSIISFWYLNCLVLLSLPRPNINTFVFEVFTLNFHFWQYSWKTRSALWRSVSLSLKITVSSAYNKINNFRNPAIFSVLMSHVTPSIFLVDRKCSRSFKYIVNKKGDKFSPCLTPLKHLKNSVLPSCVRTLDLILLSETQTNPVSYCILSPFW